MPKCYRFDLNSFSSWAKSIDVYKGDASAGPVTDVTALQYPGHDRESGVSPPLFPSMNMSRGPLVVAMVKKVNDHTGRVGIMPLRSVRRAMHQADIDPPVGGTEVSGKKAFRFGPAHMGEAVDRGVPDPHS